MGCVYMAFLLLIVSIVGLLPAIVLFAICASANKQGSHIRVLDQHIDNNNMTKKPLNTHSSMWRKKATKPGVNNDSSPQSRILPSPPPLKCNQHQRPQVIDTQRPIEMKITKESLTNIQFEQASKEDTLENVDSLPTEKSSIVDASPEVPTTIFA